MRLGAMMCVVAAGCAGGGSPDCVRLVDGPWVLDTPLVGTPVGADLATDPSGCAFTLAWGMGVSLPTGGTVDGDLLSLTGGDPVWATCAGEVSADGTSAEGTCDGGAFAFWYDEGMGPPR